MCRGRVPLYLLLEEENEDIDPLSFSGPPCGVVPLLRVESAASHCHYR